MFAISYYLIDKTIKVLVVHVVLPTRDRTAITIGTVDNKPMTLVGYKNNCLLFIKWATNYERLIFDKIVFLLLLLMPAFRSL